MSAPGASARIARRHAPHLVRDGHERPITVDQTNRSVVVDESVIVKWYEPPLRVDDHRLDVLEHLTANGFAHAPAYFGAETGGGVIIATVSELVPGALDGWDWFVDELTGWVDGDVDASTVLDDARRIGRLGGRLHGALATPSRVIPDPIGTADATTERARCRALLDEALHVVVDGDARDVLRAHRGTIQAALDAVPDGPTPTCIVHGDLHVGQLLRDRDDRLVVTDFDGNPLLDPSGRRGRRPLAVDVVSLAQSVDHAGRVAARRRPDAGPALAVLVRETAAVTLDAHLDELDRLGFRHLVDDRLLPPLRIAQELHELVYAARHLPRWSYAPTASLVDLLSDGGDDRRVGD